MNFAQHYRDLFELFGYRLGPGTSLAESTIDRAAQALDISVPAALRDFYLVAGREKRFSQCYERIIAPKDWRVSKNHLIFMEECQCVVWWGVSVRNPENDDPPVSQAVNNDDEKLAWYQESRRCSVFLSVMLHLQAVSDGLPHGGLAEHADVEDLSKRLKSGWRHYGTIGTYSAFSRQNQVVCIDTGLGVAIAARTKKDLKTMQNDLAVGPLT